MIPKECYEEYGKDLDGCSTQSNEGCGRCSLNKNEGMNPVIYGNSTTTINIDYYNELKTKADKWDEKETPFKPVDLFSNSFGDIFGKCECKSKVSIDENYCSNCGQKLDWSESEETKCT